jgi:hypothetical protein
MVEDPDPSAPNPRPPHGGAERAERLAAALRENLRRRKAQARARDAAAPKESAPTESDRQEDAQPCR